MEIYIEQTAHIDPYPLVRDFSRICIAERRSGRSGGFDDEGKGQRRRSSEGSRPDALRRPLDNKVFQVSVGVVARRLGHVL